MTWLAWPIAVLLVAPAIAARLYFLAPFRLGAVFYYGNILSDTLVKRTPLGRGVVEHISLVLGLAVLAAVGRAGLVAAAVVGGLIIWLELVARSRDRRILTSVYGRFDRRARAWQPDQREPVNIGAHPRPSVHPDLVMNLVGPFVSRRPTYDLGDLALGRAFEIEIVIANHSVIPCQVPVTLSVDAPPMLGSQMPLSFSFDPLRSGGVVRQKLAFEAREVGRSQPIRILIANADWHEVIEVGCRSVFDGEGSRPQSAKIARYPGGRRSAFAWRGDMDLYDTVSFQSIDGLKTTLGLAARYRFPQTMYLSSRLSLDEGEAEEFSSHFGVDRGRREIPAFVDWLRSDVDLCHRAPYPFESTKPFLIELGNHMHLHYGTDAAAASGNQWRLWARMGEGAYEWQGDEAGSFAEQRDNALAARRLFEERLGFTPKSWAMPDSTRDGHTPAAVEAAGCEVTSDVDARQVDNVLFQPRPHQPAGTELVELTKRYPGDPEDFIHVQMFVYWLHRGWRCAIPVVYMCHQHMRMFSGTACSRMTEYVLRHVLTEFNGDLFIDTVYGIGAYWREVLKPEGGRVTAGCDRGEVVVQNSGDLSFTDVPVDVVYEGGQRSTFLVSLQPRTAMTLDGAGRTRSHEDLS